MICQRYKDMKTKFLKLQNWLIVSLMGALGLTSCHCSKELPEAEEAKVPAVKDRGEMRLMYGVPTMEFRIRGEVKNPKGKPVEGIRVNMLERGMEVKDGELQGDPKRVEEWLDGTSVATDGEGRFEINSSGRPQEQVRLLVRDIDGKENGDYRNQVLEMKVTPEDMERTGDNRWNQGVFNKQVKIKLKKK